MIPSDLVSTLNEIRDAYRDVTDRLPDIASFRSLLGTSATLPAAVREIIAVMEHPRLRRPCDGRVTVAVVGSSGHGKTTILDEMFPGLSARGWLVTDVTDTTSQSLRIEYAPASYRVGLGFTLVGAVACAAIAAWLGLARRDSGS